MSPSDAARNLLFGGKESGLCKDVGFSDCIGSCEDGPFFLFDLFRFLLDFPLVAVVFIGMNLQASSRLTSWLAVGCGESILGSRLSDH